MYMFTKLHDRRIPNVGVHVCVGVGPVEFQLKAALRGPSALADILVEMCCASEIGVGFHVLIMNVTYVSD